MPLTLPSPGVPGEGKGRTKFATIKRHTRLLRIRPSAESIWYPASVRHAYPMMLDVTDRPVLIVGGGAVGARKARGLLRAGARHVRVVSPAFDPSMPDGVERIEAVYDPRHLEGSELVFAATDRADINESVVTDARRRGALVCRADADEQSPGDFVTPAMSEQGPIIVTVSTAGNPALAARVRDELAARFDPSWTALAAAMGILRPRILHASGREPQRRPAIFRDLASDAAARAAVDGGADALWTWLLARYPEFQRNA